MGVTEIAKMQGYVGNSVGEIRPSNRCREDCNDYKVYCKDTRRLREESVIIKYSVMPIT